jgi:hypothetical protein
MEIQTRSDEVLSLYSGIHYFDTVAEAYEAWNKDRSIWKISWFTPEKHYRYRLKLKGEPWSPESEKKLESLSSKYAMATSEELFWINQHILSPNFDDTFHKLQAGLISHVEYEREINVGCIDEVWTVEEFKAKYHI